MWPLIATLLAMAIFAVVALMVDAHTTDAIEQAAIARAEVQSGQLLGQFAAAAHADAVAKGYTQGQQMTVSTLISDGALPAGFAATDAFGLTFKALVGATSAGSTPVVAWTDGAPTSLYGLPVNAQTIQGVELQVAQNALVSQQNAGAVVGIAASNGGLQMPFASSPISLSSTFPGWSVSNPDATVVYLH